MTHALELEAVDGFTCPSCESPKGLACQTPDGRPRAPHYSRLDLALLRRRELAKLASWKAVVR